MKHCRKASVRAASSAESVGYLSLGAMSANHILANMPSSSLEAYPPGHAVIGPEEPQVVATCWEVPAELLGESVAWEDEAHTDG